MCRWVGRILLCMCKVFPAGRGEQMIVMALGDVTLVMFM